MGDTLKCGVCSALSLGQALTVLLLVFLFLGLLRFARNDKARKQHVTNVLNEYTILMLSYYLWYNHLALLLGGRDDTKLRMGTQVNWFPVPMV